MSNRIVAAAAAAAFATYAAAAVIVTTVSPAFAGEISVASTVDRPLVPIRATAADAAATQSAGTVGAMHYAVQGVATSGTDVARQGGRATAATVRWLEAPVQPGS